MRENINHTIITSPLGYYAVSCVPTHESPGDLAGALDILNVFSLGKHCGKGPPV